MTNQTRVRKSSHRVRTLTAELLERRVKDPRLGFVTVTDARLTGDLSQATVFYTAFGDADSVAETERALASATGIIRSELGRRLGLRHTPSLVFVADALPTTSASVEEALLRAAAADAEVARLAEGAAYAGDPDPYRHDDVEDTKDQDTEDQDDPADEVHYTGPQSRRAGDRTGWRRHRRWSTSPQAGHRTTWSDGCAGSPGTRKVGPRRDPRPDGDRSARARRRQGHPNARLPGRP